MQGKKIVETMRNNMDGDVTKSYRMSMQFDIYQIKPIL